MRAHPYFASFNDSLNSIGVSGQMFDLGDEQSWAIPQANESLIPSEIWESFFDTDPFSRS